MKKYIFELQMKVRDYECDIQGVVNNANYQHYLEHTRHEFLSGLGISFSGLHRQGIDAMVSKAELQYKTTLGGGDTLLSCLRVERKGVKLVFHQDIIRESDRKISCTAKIEVVVLQHGVLTRGDYFDEILKPYLTD